MKNSCATILHRGVFKILPKHFMLANGSKVKITKEKMSNELLEGLIPFDLEFVTEYEAQCRNNYIQIVNEINGLFYPRDAILETLPKETYVATADWLGDGRLITFSAINWLKKKYYSNAHKLPYDRQLKMMKYSAGPRCPANFPEDIKIEYSTGKDRLGTILVNPNVAKQILVKHRYSPYEITHLLEGSKIRGPFIKGTVVYSDEIEGISFLNGSYKNVPEGPDFAIKCGFWVENLPHYLLKDNVTLSYTLTEHLMEFGLNFPKNEKIDRLRKAELTREELYKYLLFDTKGKYQLLRVIEAIRQGVFINSGYPRTYLYSRITDELDHKVFNPKLQGIRAIGIEYNTHKKEIIIPKKFAHKYKIGEKVVLWRDPVSWIGAIQLVKIAGYSDSPVIKIPSRCAYAAQGDFDGDQYNIVSKSLFNRIFNCDIKTILHNTPAPSHYNIEKPIIQVGRSRDELYSIAKQIEVGKQATGMMIHIRDNVVMRSLGNPKTTEFVYHNGAQVVLQSKNKVDSKTNYKQLPFITAKKIANSLGLDYDLLIKKNNTLNIFRKKVQYGKFKPEPTSIMYKEILPYTIEYIKEFNIDAVLEIINEKYTSVPDKHIKSAKKIIYDTSHISNIKEREREIHRLCAKLSLHRVALIIAFLEMSKKQPFGYELSMAYSMCKTLFKE